MKDLTGQRFGRLTVMNFAFCDKYSGKNEYYWHCKCDCGNEVDIKRELLVSGNTKSCGCLRSETSAKNVRSFAGKNGKLLEFNGETHCLSEWARITGIPYSAIYSRYKSGHSPEEILSKDGLKCGGARKKKEEDCKKITAFGETHTVKYWANKYGMSYQKLYNRIKRGITPEFAITTSSEMMQLTVSYNGETHSLSEWSRITGIPYYTLKARKNRCLPPEKILFKGRLDKPKKRVYNK